MRGSDHQTAESFIKLAVAQRLRESRSAQGWTLEEAASALKRYSGPTLKAFEENGDLPCCDLVWLLNAYGMSEKELNRFLNDVQTAASRYKKGP